MAVLLRFLVCDWKKMAKTIVCSDNDGQWGHIFFIRKQKIIIFAQSKILKSYPQ